MTCCNRTTNFDLVARSIRSARACAILSGYLLLGAARAEELPRTTPQEVGLSADKLDRVKAIMRATVDKNQSAGVVVLVARRGKVVLLESSGKMDIGAGNAMSPDSI